mmetsp:Transcript_158496/g.508456  ORF Transcript_158496/g.508456 Transcript_158496/m.508456 type:complete len:180 (+) Transcript_158496:42-581(+)
MQMSKAVASALLLLSAKWCAAIAGQSTGDSHARWVDAEEELALALDNECSTGGVPAETCQLELLALRSRTLAEIASSFRSHGNASIRIASAQEAPTAIELISALAACLEGTAVCQGHDAYASINGRTFCCRSGNSVPSVSIGGFQCNGTVCALGAMRCTCSDDPGSPWVNIHNLAQKDP